MTNEEQKINPLENIPEYMTDETELMIKTFVEIMEPQDRDQATYALKSLIVMSIVAYKSKLTKRFAENLKTAKNNLLTPKE